MRMEHRGRGVVLYERERDELLQEAVLAMARLDAQRLEDREAAQVGVLFEQWTPGSTYKIGERISDGAGNLYRVLQSHTAQADWPVEGTPALYVRLGVAGWNEVEA